MEAHGGAFPSVSAVLKETGGGRNAVKDILNDVESRFTQLTSKQTSSDDSSAGRTAEEVGPASAQFIGDDALNETTSSDDSEDSDDAEGDVEEFDAEGVSSEEIIEEVGGISEAERKSVTFTNGQMIGSSHGEIETHSGLWSRLRKLGSLSQGSKQEQRSQETSSVAHDASSNVDQLRQDGTTGSVALSFSDVSDLDITNSAQKGGSNGQDLLNSKLEERHGLFVRYLSPQATPADLKEAFSDCGEIIRAQAIKPRSHQKFTYGFVDFKVCGHWHLLYMWKWMQHTAYVWFLRSLEPRECQYCRPIKIYHISLAVMSDTYSQVYYAIHCILTANFLFLICILFPRLRRLFRRH